MIRRRDVGRNHWYLNDDDQKIPGVTTILEAAIPKPKLLDWAIGVTADYAIDHWDELAAMLPSQRLRALTSAKTKANDAAKIKGGKIHRLGERVAAGETVKVPEPLAPYVEAYAQFLDDYDVEVVHAETVVWDDDESWAGTFDLIADLIPDKGVDGSPFGSPTQRWLIDIKAGNSVWGEVAWQLAPYRYADWMLVDEQVVPMIPVVRTGVIHLTPDGYELVPVEAEEPQYLQFLNFQASAAALASAPLLLGEPLTQEN